MYYRSVNNQSDFYFRSVSFCLQIYSALHSHYLDVQLKIPK